MSEVLEELVRGIIEKINMVTVSYSSSCWGKCQEIARDYVSCFTSSGMDIDDVSDFVTIHQIFFTTRVEGMGQPPGTHIVVEMFGLIYDPILANAYPEYIEAPMSKREYFLMLRELGHEFQDFQSSSEDEINKIRFYR